MDPLDHVISEEELKKFEDAYNKAQQNDEMTDEIQFGYAWCLVKSGHSIDIKKGVALFNELCRRNVADRRDYMYYLAIGYSHLHDYKKAIELLDQILRVQPNNNQVLSLKNKIKKMQHDEDVKNAAKAGGVAVAAVGVVGVLAFALAKGLSKN